MNAQNEDLSKRQRQSEGIVRSPISSGRNPKHCRNFRQKWTQKKTEIRTAMEDRTPTDKTDESEINKGKVSIPHAYRLFLYMRTRNYNKGH